MHRRAVVQDAWRPIAEPWRIRPGSTGEAGLGPELVLRQAIVGHTRYPLRSICVVDRRWRSSPEPHVEHDRLVVGRTVDIGSALHDGAHDRARALPRHEQRVEPLRARS